MYFEFKRLSDFTKKDLEEIKFFTYKDGMARPIFINAAENKLKNAEDYILTILRHDYKFILGWSLLIPKKGQCGSDSWVKNSAYMCFVRPLFRKHGLGRKIFEETTKQFSSTNEIMVYGWDERSKEFYSKIQQEKLNKKEINIW